MEISLCNWLFGLSQMKSTVILFFVCFSVFLYFCIFSMSSIVLVDFYLFFSFNTATAKGIIINFVECMTKIELVWVTK